MYFQIQNFIDVWSDFLSKEQEISGCKSLGSVHVFNMLQMINIHASGAVHTLAHILQEGNGDVVPT